jgi:hypothetical protein
MGTGKRHRGTRQEGQSTRNRRAVAAPTYSAIDERTLSLLEHVLMKDGFLRDESEKLRPPSFPLTLRAIGRSVPLVFPLMLLILLIPLLTHVVWEVAATLSITRLAVLGVALLVPVLAALFIRLDRRMDDRVTEELAKADVLEAALRRRLDDEQPVQPNERDHAIATLQMALRELPADKRLDIIDRVSMGLRQTLRNALLRRILPIVVTVGAASIGYVYLLATITVSAQIATSWSHATVWSSTLSPYWHVAILLGWIEMSILLAFIATNDRYADSLSDELVKEPAPTAVALLIPFVTLLRRRRNRAIT